MNRLRPSAALAAPLLLLAAACSDGDGARTTTPTQTPQPMVEPQPLTASYTVTFDATWTRSSHPLEAPSNPHFSRLIGGTHDARVAFWAPGALASRGIEAMAELGSTSPLDAEVETAIAGGTAELLLRGDSVPRNPGRTTLTFTVTQGRSLVTLVTMVAPSPDWFVGVAGLDLFAGGVWANEIVVPLEPWDAGTDDGRSFESENAEAIPHRPIALITTAPLAPNGVAEPLGSFTFKRVG
jgi:hypothetical protein